MASGTSSNTHTSTPKPVEAALAGPAIVDGPMPDMHLDHLADVALGEAEASGSSGGAAAGATLEDEFVKLRIRDPPAGVKGDATAAALLSTLPQVVNGVTLSQYKGPEQLPSVMKLVDKELSEPYTIFTYRYFINNWPELCFVAHVDDTMIGCIVCKAAPHKRSGKIRGYIAMLVVEKEYRGHGLGSLLVSLSMEVMKRTCDEVVLETEKSNAGALRLYYNLGFVRDKLLSKYYMNGGDAYRLKVWFT